MDGFRNDAGADIQCCLASKRCFQMRTCSTQYHQQNPEISFRTVRRTSALHSSELDRLLEPLDASMLQERADCDEVDQYLREDLLSVPATGAGLERLFNSARDICYYCRGSLHEATIQDLMILTLEEEQLTRLEKPIEGESQEALEDNEALKAIEEDAEPISEDEEFDESDDFEEDSDL
ncbi:hypothetical protein N7456_004925 [Penicillium angulare]|uniref:Uncharacterized protein n=1 Tax=Penicillium angulare TaxID=116970 RepID=A0A9W9FXG7_9EURO|nr:hypothetical protein N7456_004925 [Penicillium angulare]